MNFFSFLPDLVKFIKGLQFFTGFRQNKAENVSLRSDISLRETFWPDIPPLFTSLSDHYKIVVAKSIISCFQNITGQGCISCGTCSYPELTEDHVLTSAYVKIFRTVTRNAVNRSVWRKKDCFWLPLNKHAVNIWLSSLRIRAHRSWRIGKHLHVLHVLPSRMVGWNKLCDPEQQQLNKKKQQPPEDILSASAPAANNNNG